MSEKRISRERRFDNRRSDDRRTKLVGVAEDRRDGGERRKDERRSRPDRRS